MPSLSFRVGSQSIQESRVCLNVPRTVAEPADADLADKGRLNVNYDSCGRQKVQESEQIDEIMSLQYKKTKADICYGIRSVQKLILST